MGAPTAPPRTQPESGPWVTPTGQPLPDPPASTRKQEEEELEVEPEVDPGGENEDGTGNHQLAKEMEKVSQAARVKEASNPGASLHSTPVAMAPLPESLIDEITALRKAADDLRLEADVLKDQLHARDATLLEQPERIGQLEGLAEVLEDLRQRAQEAVSAADISKIHTVSANTSLRVALATETHRRAVLQTAQKMTQVGMIPTSKQAEGAAAHFAMAAAEMDKVGRTALEQAALNADKLHGMLQALIAAFPPSPPPYPPPLPPEPEPTAEPAPPTEP